MDGGDLDCVRLLDADSKVSLGANQYCVVVDLLTPSNALSRFAIFIVQPESYDCS